MTVDQEILDGVGAADASYTDVGTGTSSLSGYSVVGTPYDDTGGPDKGMQFVVYVSDDHSKIIVSFVGSNNGKDALGDLTLSWNQYSDSDKRSAKECIDAISMFELAKNDPQRASTELGKGYLPYATLFPEDFAAGQVKEKCVGFELKGLGI